MKQTLRLTLAHGPTTCMPTPIPPLTSRRIRLRYITEFYGSRLCTSTLIQRDPQTERKSDTFSASARRLKTTSPWPDDEPSCVPYKDAQVTLTFTRYAFLHACLRLYVLMCQVHESRHSFSIGFNLVVKDLSTLEGASVVLEELLQVLCQRSCEPRHKTTLRPNLSLVGRQSKFLRTKE